ncbi:hypothetical protein AOA12_11145 [Microbacterium sp. No. 7]|nr:hypothetical protein AOA12_11145 [Microbacterium sp. No. 7]
MTDMITTHHETSPARTVTGGRAGGWLMALSPLGFAALIVLMAGVFGRTIGTSTFAEITRTQMDALGGAWAANRAIVAAAFGIVVIGAGLVAWAHRNASPPAARAVARATVVLAAVNLAAGVLGLVDGLAAESFTTTTLGEDPAWMRSEALLPWAFGAIVVQILLLCVLLWLSRTRRKTGLVMGVLSLAVLIVVAFAAAFVPPFVVALLACPIGISWLAGQRRRASLS